MLSLAHEDRVKVRTRATSRMRIYVQIRATHAIPSIDARSNELHALAGF